MADTIAAISTAPGEGGIGIVRVSGPESKSLMKRLMLSCPEEIEPRHAYLGKIVKLFYYFVYSHDITFLPFSLGGVIFSAGFYPLAVSIL